MLLAVDIGNSNIVLGVHHLNHWIFTFRIPTFIASEQEKMAFWTAFFTQTSEKIQPFIQKIVLSSVVPSQTQPTLDILSKYSNTQPLIVNSNCYDLLPISIENKKEIGTDLVANAMAAYSLFNDNCIAVDFGTALTFTVISSTGKILGVAIAPGLKTALHALFANTAQLPEVPLKVPSSVLGRDTAHALQAGVLLGYVSLINGLIERIDNELNTKCRVVATGGLSFVLKELVSRFEVVDTNLTLDGLRLILEAVESKKLNISRN